MKHWYLDKSSFRWPLVSGISVRTQLRCQIDTLRNTVSRETLYSAPGKTTHNPDIDRHSGSFHPWWRPTLIPGCWRHSRPLCRLSAGRNIPGKAELPSYQRSSVLFPEKVPFHPGEEHSEGSDLQEAEQHPRWRGTALPPSTDNACILEFWRSGMLPHLSAFTCSPVALGSGRS